jgi:hypothetical protein
MEPDGVTEPVMRTSALAGACWHSRKTVGIVYSLDLPTNYSTTPILDLLLRHLLSDDQSSHIISHQRVHSSTHRLPRNSPTMKKTTSTVQTTIVHIARTTLIRQSSMTPRSACQASGITTTRRGRRGSRRQ